MDEIKYKWETNHELKYRLLTVSMSSNIKMGLELIVKQAFMKVPNYNQSIKIFSTSIDLLKKQQTPSIYSLVNEFLLTGLKCYLLASENLEQSTKNNDKAKLIYKAQANINEGNCWIEISKIRIAEAVEIGEQRKLN